MSSVREVLPGRDYFIPNTLDKKSPDEITTEYWNQSIFTKPTTVSKAISSSMSGISQVMAHELCFRAGIDGDAPTASLNGNERSRLMQVYRDLMDNVNDGSFEPFIYYNEDLPKEFSMIRLTMYDDLSFENLPDGDPARAERSARHEEHVQSDALSAIRATVPMRYALMEYNKQAELFTQAHADESYAKYKPHIRIGSGLNSGRATVGFMGSYHKMEFTSIGDAVNLASRTESSNKPCGTDILITQDTYDILKYNYIR
jgi:predicted ribosome quality control (RQC) complex YloA/Tae2 family protein